MDPDPHPDSQADSARPGQDSGRADENQAGTSAQFAAGQRFDTEMAGLPLAEALAGVRAGLGSLDDDGLAGFLGGCQKIAAWSAGMLLDGIAEFAGRRPDDGTPGRAVLDAAAVKKARAALAAGEPADPPGCDEFTADELMPVLRLSKSGAQRQVGLALALRYRLRGTLAALLDGRIDVIRARIIAEATSDLSAADAAVVDALVLSRAGKQTYVALGLAIGKAVVRVDPAGAMKRRKRGEKQARVERWREYDGTGALAGRSLPPDDTAAADQALTARAVELRAAGLDGPLDYLRAVALIDRITGRARVWTPARRTPARLAPTLAGTRTGTTGKTGPPWTPGSWTSPARPGTMAVLAPMTAIRTPKKAALASRAAMARAAARTPTVPARMAGAAGLDRRHGRVGSVSSPSGAGNGSRRGST
jgi:hypothetical protein